MKKSLCIGIDNYKTSPLSGCINDATCISELLKRNGDGSTNFEVKFEKDVSSTSNMKELIVDLFNGDCDTVLFYFSGHGFLNEFGGYIVTPDFKKYDEGVPMDYILNVANKSKIKNKIIILDCCHSGAMGNTDVSDNKSSLSEGLSILTACRNTELAEEINGHGVFTNLLLEALKGGAADLRGNISPGGIYSFIDRSLGAWYQRPVFKTNVTRFVSLRTVMPQVPDDILRSIIEYFPNPTDEFPLNPSFEDTNSLNVEHEVIEPYANIENTKIFKKLQKLQSVGLVVPVEADFMYFAAMESRSCKLTPLGHHYWNLAKEDRI
ncbi:MAG: caspase family protein [Chitinispirillales bacterium]|jgi:hypothetical protein|nr:caspase family protein [Chitinispirillales bacterium]